MEISSDVVTIIYKQFNYKLWRIKHIILMLWIMLIFIRLWSWLTCSSSATVSNIIESSKCSFTGFTDTQIDAVVSGSISNSLYLMYFLFSPANAVIRKINQDNTVAWMTTTGKFGPTLKCLSVDLSESNVYFTSYTNSLSVWRLQTSSGAIVDAQTF